MDAVVGFFYDKKAAFLKDGVYFFILFIFIVWLAPCINLPVSSLIIVHYFPVLGRIFFLG